MDIHNAITPANVLLWTLLALLLTWMVIFAILAVRRAPTAKTESRTMTSTPAISRQKVSKTTPSVSSAMFQLAAVPSRVSTMPQTSSKEEVVLEQSLR